MMFTGEACAVSNSSATASVRPRRAHRAVIFVDESAEPLSSLDRRGRIDHSACGVVRCSLLAALMRPMAVVMREPAGQLAA